MNKSNQTFSNLIDGEIGPDNIANLFYNKDKELFNSVGYDDESMSNLKNKIGKMVNDSSIEKLIFNVNEVKNAVLSLKNDKKEESGLDTDHYINGPDRLFVIICLLFNSMLIHGRAPSDFLIGTMIPIVKDYRKSCKRSDNYKQSIRSINEMNSIKPRFFFFAILKTKYSIFYFINIENQFFDGTIIYHFSDFIFKIRHTFIVIADRVK